MADPVELVRAFVNTVDVESGEDRLATRAGLAEWLTAQGLDGGDDRVAVTPAELRLARDLRSVLREALRTHHGAAGGDHDDHHAHDAHDAPALRATDEARRVSAQLPLRVELAADGSPALVAAASTGARQGLGTIVAAVASLPRVDWERLKICPADDCQWAFYDTSRNRSRRWCSMAVCGNRAKVRSYRQRA